MNDRLENLVKRMPRHIEPARDLWPEIEAQLQPRRRRAARMPLYRLAAVVLVVAIALGAYFALRPSASVPGNVGQVALAPFAAGPDALIARNLAAVDKTIAGIRAALQRDPDNPALYDFLDEAYRQKNRLMVVRTKLFLTKSYKS